MYSYEIDPKNTAYPYRVSNPDTGIIYWVASEKKARDAVAQGNSRFVLPCDKCKDDCRTCTCIHF